MLRTNYIHSEEDTSEYFVLFYSVGAVAPKGPSASPIKQKFFQPSAQTTRPDFGHSQISLQLQLQNPYLELREFYH